MDYILKEGQKQEKLLENKCLYQDTPKTTKQNECEIFTRESNHRTLYTPLGIQNSLGITPLQFLPWRFSYIQRKTSTTHHTFHT